MEYFAGANTKNGFVSLFDECFKNINRLFILKGSSGCGKSTLLKKIKHEAESKKLKTDIIRCSGDPDSLDGVIIPSLSVAVADGTSPHLLDVKYPCVRETIINLGQFWDEKKLLPKRNEIIALTDKKSGHYKTAYSALAALGNLSDIKNDLVLRSLDRLKLDSFAFGFCDKVLNHLKRGNKQPLFASAFTSAGEITVETFGNVNKLVIFNGVASKMLISAIYKIVCERGIAHIVSLSPTDCSVPESLYFHEEGILLTTCKQPPCSYALEEKVISSSRFTDNTKLSLYRARLRTIDKIETELKNDAKTELALAKETHNALEAIFIPAMDFSAMNKYTSELISKLFNE